MKAEKAEKSEISFSVAEKSKNKSKIAENNKKIDEK